MRIDAENNLFDVIDNYHSTTQAAIIMLWNDIASNCIPQISSENPDQTTNILQYIYLNMDASLDDRLYLIKNIIESFPSIAYEANANPDKANKDFAWWLMSEIAHPKSMEQLIAVNWDFSKNNKGGNSFLHQIEDSDFDETLFSLSLDYAAPLLRQCNCWRSLDSIGNTPSTCHLFKGNIRTLDYLLRHGMYIHDTATTALNIHQDAIGWYRMQVNHHLLTSKNTQKPDASISMQKRPKKKSL